MESEDKRRVLFEHIFVSKLAEGSMGGLRLQYCQDYLVFSSEFCSMGTSAKYQCV